MRSSSHANTKSAVLILKQHSRCRRTPKESLRPSFDIRSNKESWTRPEDGNKPASWLRCSCVSISISGTSWVRIKPWWVKGGIHAENVKHLMESSWSDGLEEPIAQRSSSIHQTISIENNPAHGRPSNLQSTIGRRCQPIPKILARLTSGSISLRFVSDVGYIEMKIRSWNALSLIIWRSVVIHA